MSMIVTVRLSLCHGQLFHVRNRLSAFAGHLPKINLFR
jgi:hypothetical protein